jgi:hypothetical protein
MFLKTHKQEKRHPAALRGEGKEEEEELMMKEQFLLISHCFCVKGFL